MGELFVSRSADRDDPGNPGVYARRQPPDSAPLPAASQPSKRIVLEMPFL